MQIEVWKRQWSLIASLKQNWAMKIIQILILISGGLGSSGYPNDFNYSSQYYHTKSTHIFVASCKKFMRSNNEFPIYEYLNFVHQNKFVYLKSRFFKNRKLYWSNLPQNSNLGRESFVQKSGVQIPVGEGQIFCHFSFFLYLFHFVHKKLNIKT